MRPQVRPKRLKKTTMKNATKSLRAFFAQSSHPDFFRKVWELGGVPWEDFKECPNDYRAANTGAAPGCIYYSDTVPFAKRNLETIHEVLRDFEKETGAQLENMPRYSDDETQYYNWLTWFAWENMAGELISYLEQD